MRTLLQKLAGAASPCGREQEMRSLILSEIEPLVDEVKVDALGSLIVHKARAAGGTVGLRIMITAPMDEPGLIASHIGQDGFVHFSPIGHLSAQFLPGSRVRFLNGVQGVVAPAQIADGGATAPEQMVIDVGAARREDCPVQAGELAALEHSFEQVGDYLTGRFLGGRAVLLAALETLRRLAATANELYFVFAAQGQTGSRALLTSSYGIEPDVALSLGTTAADDSEDTPMHCPVMGKGPVIQISNAAMMADPRIISWLVRGAEKARLPYQRQVQPLAISDALNLQNVRAGISTGALAIPVRYLGSPVEMISMEDVLQLSKLLAGLLRLPVRLEA